MNLPAVQTAWPRLLKRLSQSRVLIFIGALVLIYGFVIWRSQTLRDAKPSASATASQTAVSKPHIDQATINKIKQLQDNSVSVQALFSQARKNPFQE